MKICKRGAIVFELICVDDLTWRFTWEETSIITFAQNLPDIFSYFVELHREKQANFHATGKYRLYSTEVHFE